MSIKRARSVVYRFQSLAVPLVLVLAVLPRPSAVHAQQVGPSTPSPRALAISRGAFPSHARVNGGVASNASAGSASGLHIVSLNELGRLSGYVETAQWQAAATRRGENRAVSFRYIASVFTSSTQAQAALGDARASLWEIGRPFALSGIVGSVFDVEERDAHGNIFVLLQRGAVELEMRLRYGTSLARPSLRWSEWYLGRAVRAAEGVLGAVSAHQPLPPGTASVPSGADPQLFVAPWGTGPIVKSPSLMVVDSLSTEQGADPGAYRAPIGPAMATRSLSFTSILPRGSISRFVRTAATPGGERWYNSATLYSNARAAATALDALTRATDARGWLHAYDLHSVDAHPPGETWSAWRGHGESVLLARNENALMVLATSGDSPKSVSSLGGVILDKLPSWLHADGTKIVNSRGTPVSLAYLNWYGAEQQDFIVGGLDFRSYQTILSLIAHLGYTGIRLPFSNQMVEQNPIITAHVAANPELAGLHALDILDRIVAYAGALGLSVVLDNHRSEAGWSSQESGLWYTADYPDGAFMRDWTTMSTRYAVNDVVVGADLRNEPHGPSTWGDGNPATNWRLAAERTGNAALASNPHLLIIVEGTQYVGASGSYWWGGNLMGVATAPVRLTLADGSSGRDHLVYSAHDYGPDNCNTGCPWFNATTTFDTLAATWDRFWGFISADPTKPYAAPVLIGEFGTCNYDVQCVADTKAGSQGQWFGSLLHYIAMKHLGWAYWSINGTESTAGTRIYGNLDWYGFFARDWTTPIAWLNAALASIEQNAAT